MQNFVTPGIFLLSAVSSIPVFPAEKSDQKKPNIVLLIADDLRWNSLGCMGNKLLQTPNIDKLSHEGVRFTHACVTTSICMVSRATMLTGQYMSRHGIAKFGVELPEKAISETYPAILRKSGYWTGYVGKFGVGHIRKNEFDFWTEYEGKHWLPNGKGDSIQVTEKNRQDALKFLNTRPKDKPFLLTVGFFAVHAQDDHPDQYRFQPQSIKYYQNDFIPLPKTGDDKYFKRLPPFLSTEENEGRVRWHWRFDTPDKYQKYMKAYYRMLTEEDLAIGDIVSELKKEGVYDNTLIIFIGDNGYFHGDHGLADKWYPYEEALRVPLIVRDPRMDASRKNSTNDEFVLNIDVAPMIIAAAGDKIPETMQGKDFSTLYMKNSSVDWRTEFYYEHPVVLNEKRIPASEALVTHHDKYIYWPNYNYEEYFDLQKDPFEEHNAIKDKEYSSAISVIKQHFNKLKQLAR